MDRMNFPAERLRRQRRHMFYGLAICALLATIGASYLPPVWVVGALVWAVVAIFGWPIAVEVGHWWTRRRTEHKFDQHVADVLDVVRARHPSSRPVPPEDQPGWDTYRRAR